ncbi:MAG TPA: hypothetical protein VIA18_07255 [Polyangia bacterium]|jgi:hypothetical protein|nr:hypothetical protein [Polyangia bacterium]
MEKPFSIQELNAILPRLRATVEAAARLAEVQRAVEQIAQPAVRRGRPPKGETVAAPPSNGGGRGRKNDPAAASTLRSRIVSYLGSAKKGAALRDIANALDADAEAVRYGLNLLRGDKKVRMTGSRATALWHAGS